MGVDRPVSSFAAWKSCSVDKERVDLDNVTIEHIMPQTITDTWRAELGSAARDIHARLLDTFGNLTLTGYNTELGNLPFPDKKAKLENTHIELNRDVLKVEHWRDTEIEARANRMFDIAIKLWPGPLPSAQ